MKTAEIQAQITALKGMAREWSETKSALDWEDFCLGLNKLVEISINSVPPRTVIKEVEVVREVPVIKEVTLEVPTTIFVPLFEKEA